VGDGEVVCSERLGGLPLGWSARQALPYFIAAFLPFGPFVSDRKLRVVEERLGRGEMS
jgi:hypothetical protein